MAVRAGARMQCSSRGPPIRREGDQTRLILLFLGGVAIQLIGKVRIKHNICMMAATLRFV